MTNDTKFRVCQVWADRDGKQYDVIRTNLPMPYPTQIRDTHGNSSARTASGNYYTSGIDMLDLITLIKDTEETVNSPVIKNIEKDIPTDAPTPAEVSDKIQKLWNDTVSKLPPEPVPGQYYRTRKGSKLKFHGKVAKWYKK